MEEQDLIDRNWTFWANFANVRPQIFKVSIQISILLCISRELAGKPLSDGLLGFHCPTQIFQCPSLTLGWIKCHGNMLQDVFLPNPVTSRRHLKRHVHFPLLRVALWTFCKTLCVSIITRRAEYLAETVLIKRKPIPVSFMIKSTNWSTFPL